MNILHIIISLTNILCGLSVLVAYCFEPASLKLLLGYGIFIGYFAHVVAVLITLILIGLEAYSFLKHKKHIFKRHWLGFLNGTFVIMFLGLRRPFIQGANSYLIRKLKRTLARAANAA